MLTVLPAGCMLVQCVPAAPVSTVPLPDQARILKAAEPVVYNRDTLACLFVAWHRAAQNPINFRLAGELAGKWRSFLSEELWGEFARSCTIAYMEPGQVSLTLEYRDYVLLRAAMRDTTVAAGLTSEQREALQCARAMAAAVLRPGMSDFDKLLALHDSLVQHARYDACGGGNVYDILRGGTGSCEAYSAALCVLCELAGIPCRLVTGSADGPHAWNLVQLDGAWYHVDATWDDPIIAGGSQQEVSHAWFCLSDAEIARTHSWNRAAYPASACITAHYYRSKGIYFKDFYTFWRAAMAAFRQGEMRFEGYLAAYGSSSRFEKNLRRVATPETPRNISWTGPESGAGAVIVSFKS